MLVSAGVWEENDYILPAEGELQEDEAIALAIRIVKDTCNKELTAENSEVWSVQSALGFIRDENTGKDMPSWEVCFVPSSDESSEAHGYIVTFSRKGRAKKRIEHRSGSDKRKLSIANKRGRRPANNIWFYHKPIIAGKYYRLGTHIT